MGPAGCRGDLVKLGLEEGSREKSQGSGTAILPDEVVREEHRAWELGEGSGAK